MNFNYKKVGIISMILLLLFTIVGPIEIAAESTYPSYNYSYWEDSQPSAVPYLPEEILDGIDEEYGRLSSPEDIFVTKNMLKLSCLDQ